MYCPFCKYEVMLAKKNSYHKTQVKSPQPTNDILSVLYECTTCGTTVETSQQVRIVSPKEK